MNITQATHDYERWLGKYLLLEQTDLKFKHARMGENPFVFLRATLYWFAQRCQQHLPSVLEVPHVPGVADAHLENFGTWRDTEGRLIWGINDFDEACELPYTFDLIRLAASALLAIDLGELKLEAGAACRAIQRGYKAALEAGGQAFVLEGVHGPLRRLAEAVLPSAKNFWQKLGQLETVTAPPREVLNVLKAAMPEVDLEFSVHRRVAGLGSLGRPRFVALAEWKGGLIAREAKPLTPSACAWAGLVNMKKHSQRDVLEGAVRSPDPVLRLRGGWCVRRLAADAIRLELNSLPRRGQQAVLEAMGWESANIHLGNPKVVREVLRDLERRERDWLLEAAQVMAKDTRTDAHSWRQT